MAHLRLRVVESNGKENKIVWNPNSGIGGLGNAVWIKTGVPRDYQRLFIRGNKIHPRLLEGNMQFCEPHEVPLCIADGDTIQLVVNKISGLYPSYLDYAAGMTSGLYPSYLAYATEDKHAETEELVRYLIESGEDDLDARVDRTTALHKCADSHISRRIREDLVGVGANCDAEAGIGTPLHMATYGMHRANPMADLLCGGANPNALTRSSNTTPLIRAAEGGMEDAVCELIESGAALDVTNSMYRNALYEAALDLHNPDCALNILGALLSAGANPDFRFEREDIDYVNPSAFKVLNMASDLQERLPRSSAPRRPRG